MLPTVFGFMSRDLLMRIALFPPWQVKLTLPVCVCVSVCDCVRARERLLITANEGVLRVQNRSNSEGYSFREPARVSAGNSRGFIVPGCDINLFT